MADDNLGDLYVGVQADISDFSAQLDAAAAEAQSGGAAIAAGMEAGLAPLQELNNQLGLFEEQEAQLAAGAAEVGTQLGLFGAEFIQLEGAVESAAERFTRLQGAFESTAASAVTLETASEEATGALATLGAGAAAATEGIEALLGSLASVASGLIGLLLLKQLVEDIATAFANLEKSTAALAAISGDAAGASAAMSKLLDLSNLLGISIEQAANAQQKLVAIGLPLQDVASTLNAIADGATAMNTAFDSAAQRFTMIVESGTLSARSLQSLGLNIKDLASAMDMVGSPAKDVVAAFKATGDEADRSAILVEALKEKFPDLAANMDTVSKAWNAVANAGTVALQQMGAAVGGFKDIVQVVVYGIKSLESAFLLLLVPLKAVYDAIVLLFNGAVDVLTGLSNAMASAISGNFAQALQAITDTGARVSMDMSQFATAVQAAWTTSMQAIPKVWDDSTTAINTATNRTLPPFAAAKDAIDKLNDSFEKAADKALDAFLRMQAGTGTAAAALSALNKVIEDGELEWDKLSVASKQTFGELESAAATAREAIQNALDSKVFQAFVDGMAKVLDEADKLQAQVPADFDAMVAAINNGANFTGIEKKFDDVLAKLKADFDTFSLGGLDNGFTDAILQQIDKITQERDALVDLNNVYKLLATDTTMDKLAAQVVSLSHALDAGQISETQFQQGWDQLVTTLTSKVIPALEKGAQITPQLVAALNQLGPAGQALGGAATQGVDAFANAVAADAEKIRAAALTIDTAFKDLGVVSLDQAKQTLQRDGDDIVAIFKNISNASELTGQQFLTDQNAVISFVEKVLPLMQQFGLVLNDDVLAAINKISPAMAAALATSVSATVDALATMKTAATNAIMTVAAAYTQFGLQSTAVLDNLLTKQEAAYDLLVKSSAPLQDQLLAEKAILDTQLKIAAATDLTGQSELTIAENTTLVTLKMAALHAETMGLADAWNGFAGAISKAWDSMGQGIGQAIANGQSLSAVFDQIWKQLEASIIEVAVKYIQGQLLAALTNLGGVMGGLTDSANTLGKSLFSAFGLTQNATGGATGILGSGISSGAGFTNGAGDSLGGTLASGAGEGGGLASVLGTGIAGIATAVGAVVTAITSIIGLVQTARTNDLLGEIEVSTREINAGINNATGVGINTYKTWQAVQYCAERLADLENSSLPGVADNINGHLDPINTAIQAMAGMLQSCSSSLLAIAAAVTGGHLTVQGAGGSSGLGGATMTNYFQITNADPQLLAAQVIALLQQMGIKVG